MSNARTVVDDDKSKKIRKERDAAFSIDLGIEQGDKIGFMISRSDGLYAISLAKIIRINTADNVDPELQYHDAPTTQTLYLTEGSRNPIIARTALQVEDFLQLVSHSDEEKKKLRDITWEVMSSLLAYDRIITRLQNSIEAKKTELLPEYEKYVTGFSPPPIPGIEGLEIEFRSAVLIANHALNVISDLFPDFFHENIKRGRYDKIIEWCIQRFGKEDILSAMLVEDHRWINLWGEVRNAFEHPRKDYFVKINNFRLLPDRTIQLPTWQLKHPTFPDLFRPQQLIETSGAHRDNILTFFENLLVVLFDKTAAPGVFVEIIDIPEKDRNPDCPKRYECRLVIGSPQHDTSS